MIIKSLSSNECLLVLKNGEEVITSISAYCSKTGIRAATFSGIGALSKATLGYFNTEKMNYEFKVFNKVEVGSLTGNVSSSGNELIVHAHAVLGDESLKSYAGHLKEGLAYPTIELIVKSSDAQVIRERDDETGLNLVI